MSYFEECKKRFGSVVFDGVECALLCDAYIDNGQDGDPVFKAEAFSIDQLNKASEKNEIDVMFDEHAVVTWDCSEWWNDGDNDGDSGEACDWDSPVSIKVIW